MFASKSLIHRLAPVLITLVLLGSTIPLAVSAAMPNTDQWSGEQESVLASSNAQANIYLPLVQRSMCGKITVDTTWTVTASPIRVACDVIVSSGVTLTIEAGVMVQFAHTDDDLIISGTLQAAGAEYAPIHFNPSSNTTPGSWGRVSFTAGSSGVLDHTILEYGGGCLVSIGSDAVQVVDSVVQYSGGTGICIGDASPLISGTQVLSNTNTGLSNYSGNPTIQNNTFSNNVTYEWCCSDFPDGGGGLYNHHGSPTIQNNIFSNNVVIDQDYEGESYGGGLFTLAGSPIIQNNIFINNSVYGNYSAGGGLYNWGGNPIIQNNTFTGNSATAGGGIYNYLGNLIIQNNTFTDNSANTGGGLCVSGSSTIQNNTFYNNSANAGGGLYVSGRHTILNNIVVNNEGSGIELSSYDDPLFTPDYNDVWNNTGGNYANLTPGAHDISYDPLLVDPANGDFHLTPSSPCMDAGDPDHHPADDFDGDPRPMGLAPDIGADEYHSLRVTKISTTDETSPGGTITYAMTLANLVTSTLTNVLLTDTLPVETAFTGYQSDGLACSHDGSDWGGQFTCKFDNAFLAPGESRALTVTVLLTETFLQPQFVTNPVTVTARNGGTTFIAHDQARTWATWCAVQLNDTPMGRDLQAAIDASTQPSDVVKVSGYCPVHDLVLNKTLILQGGWSYDFNKWDPTIYTTLDGQDLGRVIEVAGMVNPSIEGFVITGGWSDLGGGIYISSGSPTIQNNTFTRNHGSFGGGLNNGSGSPIIQNNTFTGNLAFSYGGGLHNDSGSPIIRNNSFISNTTGGISNVSGNPIIMDNTFTGNQGEFGGGLYNGSGSPIIQNNTFSDNSATYYDYGVYGGGLYNDSGSPIIQNNTFTGNQATRYGGGLYNGSGSPVIQNNTFSYNSADNGGGLYSMGGNPTIRSNIVVSNQGGGIGISSGDTITLDYNDVWNNAGGDYIGVSSPGTHDISADPLLVDPANGDFHLSPGSPCIDTGDPVNYPATDFEGDLRPQGLAPDIGADEYISGGEAFARRTPWFIHSWQPMLRSYRWL